MTEPTIEIAIPYVGDPGYLREAVMSVLCQTDPDLSVLVLIDGPDQPRVEEWLDALDDPRLRHQRLDRNVGVAGAFQHCLESGRTSHVTVLGCDDLLLPGYVALVRRTLRTDPGAVAVLPGVRVIDANGVVVRPVVDRVKAWIAPRRSGVGNPRTIAGRRLLRSLLVGNWTYFPLTCWNRHVALAHGFRPDLGVTLDLALWVDLAMAGEAVALPEEIAGAYRRHPGSVSSVTAGSTLRFAEEARLLAEIADRCRRSGWRLEAFMTRLRPTSRLHMLLLLVSAVRTSRVTDARALARELVR